MNPVSLLPHLVYKVDVTEFIKMAFKHVTIARRRTDPVANVRCLQTN